MSLFSFNRSLDTGLETGRDFVQQVIECCYFFLNSGDIVTYGLAVIVRHCNTSFKKEIMKPMANKKST
jgi:hypothetical protein